MTKKKCVLLITTLLLIVLFATSLLAQDTQYEICDDVNMCYTSNNIVEVYAHPISVEAFESLREMTLEYIKNAFLNVEMPVEVYSDDCQMYQGVEPMVVTCCDRSGTAFIGSSVFHLRDPHGFCFERGTIRHYRCGGCCGTSSQTISTGSGCGWGCTG